MTASDHMKCAVREPRPKAYGRVVRSCDCAACRALAAASYEPPTLKRFLVLALECVMLAGLLGLALVLSPLLLPFWWLSGREAKAERE